ncbi:unnamed protein product [Lactuca virosa]|uniref:Uncharacterized protein n=1 Tax=Lactuca virosa TaxID=75947 RepID=A0AAU9PBL2_9ASTR|nr:unnamed protein product [Lactuca virosa]
MCERATDRAVYARILIEMSANAPWAKEIKIKAFTAKGATSTSLRVEYSWNPKRCDHAKSLVTTTPLALLTSPPVQKTATPIPKDVDKEGFETVKRRTRAIPIPKKKVQTDNRKDKGPALKIAQVYKPIIVILRKECVVQHFDTLSHQRTNDTEDDSTSLLSPSQEIPSNLPIHIRFPLTVAISLLQLTRIDVLGLV